MATEAGRRRAPRLADGVELVDEDDARRLRLRLLEEVADARRADADEHLDELRAADREERHLGLARDRACEERLAGTGRSDEENALRDLRAELAVPLGGFQELHDLEQLALRLVDAGNVVEADLDVLLAVDARAVLADRERLADAALREAARGEAPDRHQDAEREDPREQQVAPEGVLDAPGEDHALLRQQLEERVVVDVRKAIDLEQALRLLARPARRERLPALEHLAEIVRQRGVVAHLEPDAGRADQRLLDLPLLEHRLEPAVRHRHRQ